MPITRATQPSADNPSATTNTTTTAPSPNTGGDLAAAITLLAQTLAAQNACPQVTQSAPAVPVTSLTRLREPDTFNGSDANKLRVFILQCSLHFQDCANTFSSSKAKVTYALSFLTSPALSWFEPALFSLALPAWVNDWDLFHMELEANFSSFDPAGEAKAEIKTLVMAKGSRSVIYFMEFNRLASRIQWDNHALLRQAYKGLARRIKNEMVVKIRISPRNMSKGRKWGIRDVSKNQISDSERMREWLRKPMRRSERARRCHVWVELWGTWLEP